MLNFECDYLEGAHPAILERLVETNMEKTSGYTLDCYCEQAREKIRQAVRCPEAEVHFFVGGTQTNATMIGTMLRPYEGVVAAESAHINQHEAGAVEAGGHKVLALPHSDGKLDAGVLRRYLADFFADSVYQHMVNPGMVYISHPTEYGTLYTAAEMRSIAGVCREYGLPLYLDGARLSYGLAAAGTDVTLPLIAELCDAFYIGGTKTGALFGEAAVIPRPGAVRQMFSIIKQKGALLAKGRLLGIQFDTLFTDDLYLTIARHALDMASRIAGALRSKGYEFFAEPQTNQIFAVVDPARAEALSRRVAFSTWEKRGDCPVVRFATSWATSEKDVEALIDMLP